MTQFLRSKWLIFFASCTERENESFWPKKNLITGWTKIWPKFLGQNNSVFRSVHREKKMSHFDPKNLITGGTKIWPKKNLITGRTKIWPKKLSKWPKKIWPKFLGQNDSIFLSVHWEKRLSHFDLKSWNTGGTIIRLTFITGRLS